MNVPVTKFPRLRAALLAGGLGVGLSMTAAPAFAQDDQAAADTAIEADVSEGEAIVITGSRIARRDFQANSPIQTVGSDLLQNSTSAALETSLNKLPQFSSTAKLPTAGGDIQPTATNTPGAATISLRGIGANRNLVLVNGRRVTPSNASMAVDINTIPSAAIERVEIISGGASSTYGADAVAGVTNFITKRNFQGLSLDAQIGTTEHGDNTEWTVSGIMGTDFADDRGNISLAFSTNTRKAAYQKDRSWYRDLWANPNIGGTQFFIDSPGIYFNYANLPTGINAMFPASSLPPFGGYSVYTNANGTPYVNGSWFNGPVYTPYLEGFDQSKIDGYNYKKLATGVVAKNFTENLLVLPLERYNMYARGNYEVNDWISVFGEGIFSKVSTSTAQEPGPITSGWSVTIANDGRPLPTALQSLLNSRPDTTAAYELRGILPFNRESKTDVFTYSLTAGVEGKVPGTDWTWELFGQVGEAETNVTQTGFVSLERLRGVMGAANWGAGWRAQGNQGVDAGFGAATATCTSGLNPFDTNLVISQDCIDAISTNLKTRAVMQQSVWEFNAQGSLIDLPAGTASAAIGASYRHNNYTFENDTYVTQGTMYNDQVLGLYPSGNTRGRIEAKEVYGELLIPVLADLPAIEKLELELGGRISDYNTTGTSYTYKALASWDVSSWLRLRGGFNRAERAPNVGELFLAAQQTFAYAAGGDVCSTANPLAWSANPTTNPTNAANVQALCRTLMQRSGNANADTTYYNGAQSATGAFVFPTLVGNPNLKPEKADTWTLGAVITSPFDTPWLSRLRFAVDWYSIKVTDAIGAQTVDIAQRQCFDVAFNPTFDADSVYCAAIARNTTGALGNVQTTYFNNGRFRTQGLDFQLDWSKDVGPGMLSVNSVLNYLLSLKSAELGVLNLVEYAGTTGPTQNGLDGGAYRWKLFTTVGYTVGPVGVSLQWRHLPRVLTETSAASPQTTVVGAPSYDLFNLSATWTVTNSAKLRMGVDNLLNKRPPLFGVDTAANPAVGTLSGGSYNSAYYDTIGRRFYVGVNFKL